MRSCFHSFRGVFRTLFVLSALVGTAGAGTFVVTTAADTANLNDGVLSLREAITAANGAGGTNAINFDATVFPAGGAKTIQFTSVLPDLNCDLTINGPGANVLTVRGEGYSAATP